MNIFLFLSVLRARLGLFAITFGATVLTAAVVSLLLPETYRATASLVVDTSDAQSLSNPLNILLPPREGKAYLQTQVDIITSPRVARKVVQDTRLADEPALRAAFEQSEQPIGSIEDWLAEILLRDLEVETSQSNVIDVSYVADDRERAASIANAFASAYIDTMLALRVEPTRRAANWFDEQLTTLRAELQAAQDRLTEYQQRHGIVSTDETVDLDHDRLSELSSQLVRTKEEAADLRSRELQARHILADGGTLYALPEVQSNSHIQTLRSQLLDGEARLRMLATQYGVRHPTYQQQLAENQARRQELDEEMRKIVAGTENMTRQTHSREENLEEELAAQRQHLLERRESRDELAVLMRNVETAQQVYDTVMQRAAVSQVESRASQTNVAMLNAAVPPRAQHRPKIGLNLALATAIGAMLGIGLVMMMEMSDRRVRSTVDLDSMLGLMHGTDVPLLGALGAWSPSQGRLLPGPPPTPALPDAR